MPGNVVGFDDLGRQFDMNGNLHDWWDPETKLKFLNRTQCIIDQYGNFTEPKLKINVSNCRLISSKFDKLDRFFADFVDLYRKNSEFFVNIVDLFRISITFESKLLRNGTLSSKISNLYETRR